jgi:hypothetical protein
LKCEAEKEISEAVEEGGQMVWYTSSEHVTYAGPKYCLLAWVFTKTFWVFINKRKHKSAYEIILIPV